MSAVSASAVNASTSVKVIKVHLRTIRRGIWVSLMELVVAKDLLLTTHGPRYGHNFNSLL
jgi:hypothetical protein